MSLQQGFSLSEVLAALVVTSLFFLGLSPLLLLYTLDIRRGDLMAEALGLVEQDLERLRAIAYTFAINYELNPPDCLQFSPFSPALQASLPPVNTSEDFEVQRLVELDPQLDALLVSYRVTHLANEMVVIDSYTSEVLPSAVYVCPQ